MTCQNKSDLIFVIYAKHELVCLLFAITCLDLVYVAVTVYLEVVGCSWSGLRSQCCTNHTTGQTHFSQLLRLPAESERLESNFGFGRVWDNGVQTSKRMLEGVTRICPKECNNGAAPSYKHKQHSTSRFLCKMSPKQYLYPQLFSTPEGFSSLLNDWLAVVWFSCSLTSDVALCVSGTFASWEHTTRSTRSSTSWLLNACSPTAPSPWRAAFWVSCRKRDRTENLRNLKYF